MEARMEGVSVRRAREADAPLVAELVALADRSGGATLSYQAIFGLSEAEAMEALRRIAAEDAEGQELTWSNFFVVEVEGRPVGGLAAWVEAEHGLPSAVAKGQLLAYALGSARFLAAADQLKALERIDLPRTRGALQLDSIAMLPEWQGKRLLKPLIKAAIADMLTRHPHVHTAEIVLLDTNTRARHAYEKQGFTLVHESHSDDPVVATLVNGRGRQQLRKLVSS